MIGYERWQRTGQVVLNTFVSLESLKVDGNTRIDEIRQRMQEKTEKIISSCRSDGREYVVQQTFDQYDVVQPSGRDLFLVTNISLAHAGDTMVGEIVNNLSFRVLDHHQQVRDDDGMLWYRRGLGWERIA